MDGVSPLLTVTLPDLNNAELDTPNTTPSISGNVTPNVEEVEHEEPKLINVLCQEGLSEKQESDSLAISDLDSDPEPETLLSSYLSTKAHLFEIYPELAANGSTKARKPNRKVSTPTTKAANPSALATKLQNKLIKIESDILFDQYEADRRWLTKRNELSEELAARKALGLSNTRPAKAPQSVGGLSAADKNTTEALNQHDDSGADDNDITLGDLFMGLPDSEIDAATGATNTKVTNPEGTSVTIRDFGTWTGLSPARILDEACRARYVSCPSPSITLIDLAVVIFTLCQYEMYIIRG